MKKLIIFTIAFIFGVFAIGCSRDNHKTNWNMNYIQGKGGEIIYCSNENKDNYLNATTKDIVCTLEESSIIITDKDTGEEWIGKCEIVDKDSESTLYKIIFDNNETGYLVKSFTKYADNTQHGTLIISNNQYLLNFTENIKQTN